MQQGREVTSELVFESAASPAPLLGFHEESQSSAVPEPAAALLFLVVSYITHLSWELGWLLLHRAIAGAADQAWAYGWWAYIDGGDLRYALAPPLMGISRSR